MSDLWYSKKLPFATAPSIVRSHQKDSYFISQFEKKINDLIRNIKGARFISVYNKEINILSKLVYFIVTTGFGARTLGEEYVDLGYVNRTGYKRVNILRRIGFVLSYLLLPYLLSKFIKVINNNMHFRNGKGKLIKKIIDKLTFINVMDIMNLHLALFYFSGKYYDLSKRIFGLRYVFRYQPNNESRQAKGNYEILGGLMLIQLIIKYSSILNSSIKNILNNILQNNEGHDIKDEFNSFRKEIGKGIYKNVVKMGDNQKTNNDDYSDYDNKDQENQNNTLSVTIIDLSDPKQLPYISEQSRNCMLCLSYMKDPTCASCGHIFCWGCILDWCKERLECPLCRSNIKPSQLLPLR